MAQRMTTRTWTLELPDQPYSTPNSRDHWTVRNARAQAWREAAGWCARQKRIPPQQRIRVSLVMLPKDRRRRDEDNLVLVLKHAIDGLVDAGIVPDDSPEFVQADMPRIRPAAKRPQHRWLLTVEPLEGDVDG